MRRGGRNAENYSVLVRYQMADGTKDELNAIGKLPDGIGSDTAAVHLKMERERRPMVCGQVR